MLNNKTLKILTCCLSLFSAPMVARAQEPVSFKGQRITILIGYGVGGGYDLYGRLAARFLSKYLPGNPTVVAQNMTGAGSLTAASHLYNVAAKDGTVLGVIGQTVPVDQILGETPRTFDATKFNWIGRLASGTETIISWHTVPVKSISDVKKQEVIVAGAGPSSGSTIYPIVLNNLIGTKFKVVSGYAGTKEMLIAMERGEVGACGAINLSTLTAEFPSWLKEKKINILAQVSVLPHPIIPDVPTIASLGNMAEDRDVLKLVALGGDIGRALLAPPGLAPERVKVLRDAFDQMLKDPELLAFAEKNRFDISPLAGSDLQKLVEGLRDISPAVIEKLMQARRPNR
jgi:tripartite-type tricarboxylate transporter receptor subunit TctC